jgi:hypothetical protein
MTQGTHVRTESGTLGQVDAQQVPRYAGLGTFARLPQQHEVDRYDIAVVGVPFDSGVTYRPGARFGPAAIRQVSRLLKPYHPALDVSPFAQAQVVDAVAAGVHLAAMHDRFADARPLGRIGSPDEVAAAVELLSDFELESVVGQVISCNGGSTRTRA